MHNLERKREYIISDSIGIQVEIEPVEFDDMANRALDRIDIQVGIEPVEFDDMAAFISSALRFGSNWRRSHIWNLSVRVGTSYSI